jgi:hypothetical protein
MRRRFFCFTLLFASLVYFGTSAGDCAVITPKHDKKSAVSPDDPTAKVFEILNNTYEGKLADYYLVADVYADAAHPGQDFQHILRVQYDKSLFFGRFRIYVRGLAKPTPDQTKAYTVQQLYDFASDSQKFEKIEPGPFGQQGDLYLHSDGNMPLASTPVTPEAQATYEKLLTVYLIPALSKGKSAN